MPRSIRRRSSTRPRQLTVRDIWGDRWYVSERRPTPYGFAVYMGWPNSPDGPQKGGKAAVIVTAPLAAHIRANLQRPYFLPLPMGDNARRRVRQLLGADHRAWTDTRLAWWIDRIDDLATLPAIRFVAKHEASAWTRNGKMSTTLVCLMRIALLGHQRRPLGWWKSPAVQALVHSALPIRIIAEQLRLSPFTVYGVRQRVLRLRPRGAERSGGGDHG